MPSPTSQRRQAATAKKQPQQKVTVVGGGLAGQVAALRLVQAGLNVTLYEKSERLGGKAGSDEFPSVYNGSFEKLDGQALPAGVKSDHGYHVFPKWYVCMRALWQEIGLDAETEVSEGKDYRLLPKAVNGKRSAFKDEPPERDLRRLAAILELCNVEGDQLDNVSLQAFLYSRDYNDLYNPITLNDYVLNALTIGDKDLSARSVRNVFWQWLPVFFQHNWDGLRGSLDELLIQRIRSATIAAAKQGAGRYTERLEHELTDIAPHKDGVALRITGHGKNRRITGQPVVMCIPLNNLREFGSRAISEQTDDLANLYSLRANTFSAIDIFFSEKLPGFAEAEHFTLEVAPEDLYGPNDLGLTAYDISEHWPALQAAGKTVVQFVAADSTSFLPYSEVDFVRRIVDAIGAYIPEVHTKVDYFVPHKNDDAPLFVNEVGSWQYRPGTRCAGIDQLYFGGDFTQHETDVASMEAAVRSGMKAAQAVLEDLQQPVDFDIPPALTKPPAIDAFGLAPAAMGQMLFAGWVREGKAAQLQAEAAAQATDPGSDA